MTKKEELLNFINTEMTGMDFLKTKEVILYSPDGHVVEFGQEIEKELFLKTDKLISKITNNFDDELIGRFSDNDPVSSQILSWEKFDRPIHMYE